jgi:FeoB-associated Cys-rich membrane protein
MLQTIIIGILLLAALFYLGRMVLRALKGDASCGGGCAKCAIAENKPTTVK